VAVEPGELGELAELGIRPVVAVGSGLARSRPPPESGSRAGGRVAGAVIAFTGVSHVAFTVTDLTVSQHFYTTVLDFVPVLDVGYGRICMHPATGFTLGLIQHPGAARQRFTELSTGLDHLGLAASSRAELEHWERRFERLGVTYTPIRDMEMGYHLNFRDPDGIALEFDAPNELALVARTALAAHPTPAEIAAFVAEHLGPEYVPAG
jgi:glyoxylase I family protein